MLVALRRGQNKFFRLRAAGRLFNGFPGQPTAKIDIFINGAGKERVRLERHAEQPVKPGFLHPGDVLAVHVDSAFAQRIESLQQLDQRGFAAAGGPDHAQRFALPYGKGHGA